MQEIIRIQTLFTALPLAFGVLHLFLWAAMPRLRSNLFYGVFLLAIASTVFFDFQERLANSMPVEMLVLSIHRGSLAVAITFVIRFFYEVFLGTAPRRFRYLGGALLVAGALAAIWPVALFWPLQIVVTVAMIEGVRVTIRAVLQRQEDARLLAGGVLTFLAFASYDMLLDFGVIDPVSGVLNAYQAGLIGLFVATSAYLARSMARTHAQLTERERRVQEQDVQTRLLEAEVGRTRAELEEARDLQLSMLPAALPKRPDLRFAVHMNTAVEVGGDYYDFREGADGTLTVAIGDATGHGLRAGFMVAVAKSLFHGLRDDEKLPDFFNRCTSVLKPMRLGNLFMALSLVRVRPGGLTFAAAGMPPALVFRASGGVIEEIALRGMPVGAFAGFTYEHLWVPFEPGDVLLLMTDGLPEQFDERREQLGMERVRHAFAGVARLEPEAIVDRLRAVGEEWRAKAPQADDLTILVMKATEPGQRTSAPSTS